MSVHYLTTSELAERIKVVCRNGDTRMAKGDDVGEDEFPGNCAWQEDE